MINKLLAAISIIVLLFPSFSFAWWDAAYLNRRKVTFDNGSSTVALTNFPVLITLNSSNIDYAKTQNSGQDIRFVDSDDTTALNYEIEKWDESATSTVWAKVPSVSTGTADFIYMYYNNTGASDGQQVTSTWDTNYIGVWHLKEDNSSTTILESTVNHSTSTKNGVSSPTSTLGAIDGAQYFHGQSFDADKISVSTTSYNNLTQTTTTWDFWIDREDATSSLVMGKSDNNVDSGWVITNAPIGSMRWEAIRASTNNLCSISSIPTSTAHIVYTYAGANPPTSCVGLTAYINGVSVTVTVSSPGSGAQNSDVNDSFGLGQNVYAGGGATTWYAGMLDEVRISNVVRSVDYVVAEYKNGVNTFNTFGAEESASSSGSTPLRVTASSTLTSGNSTPAVTNVVVNGGSAITLTANATTTVRVSFTVADNNGCGDVFFSGNVTTTLFRSGVSSTCAVSNPSPGNLNTLNCYVVATTTNNCPSATSTTVSANATSTFDVWYFAQATDSSSSYATNTWQGFVIARDALSTTNSTTSAGVELNTLLGIDITSSTAYGTVAAGFDTTSTNQTVSVKNAGNASTTLSINGTAMTSGGNSIPTSSQHYATGTFTYGGVEQALQSAATAVSGFLDNPAPLAPWRTATSMNSGRRYHAAFAHRDYAYALAGTDSGGTTVSSTEFTHIQPGGNITNWSSTTSLPREMFHHTGVPYGGYVYVLGGNDAGSNVTSSVLFAPINATGSLGAWTYTTPLPAVREKLSALAYNGYVYAMGGTNDLFTLQSNVYFGPITATGSISNWSSTTAMPGARAQQEGCITNNTMYVIGSNEPTSTVISAPINSTGSLGAWSVVSTLPYTIYGEGVVCDQGIVYVIGGFPGGASAATSSVLFSIITSTSTLSSWSLASPLPVNVMPDVGLNNGYAYTFGGFDGVGTNRANVYYTPLASRNTYWGLAAPGGQASGDYTGVNTFTAVFSP